jgi:hypothetical protein
MVIKSIKADDGGVDVCLQVTIIQDFVCTFAVRDCHHNTGRLFENKQVTIISYPKRS